MFYADNLVIVSPTNLTQAKPRPSQISTITPCGELDKCSKPSFQKRSNQKLNLAVNEEKQATPTLTQVLQSTATGTFCSPEKEVKVTAIQVRKK